jgi:4-amino-4-deoxy-L-arabinose transferase-like glycosyltransferase
MICSTKTTYCLGTSNQMRMIRFLRRQCVGIILILLIGWYGLVTLPYLGDFPAVNWDEGAMASAAYKLASEGIWGTDLFTGYYRGSERLYYYMPFYSALSAYAIHWFGLSVTVVRLIPALSGLLVVLLTFSLGRWLASDWIGLAAASLLCCMRLSLAPQVSGIPLLDLARVARQDLLVPMWVLAACASFCWAQQRHNLWGYALTGCLIGLATLSHVYGAFIFAPLLGAWFWHEGARPLRSVSLYVLFGAYSMTLLPWLLYVSADFDAYQGQMLRHIGLGRFDLFNPWFYWNSLVLERWRYAAWVGGHFHQPVLWPRMGIWVLLLGAPASSVWLWQRARRRHSLPDRLLCLALPTLFSLLALLVNLKLYGYIAILMPFLALQLAMSFAHLWQWAQTTHYAQIIRLSCLICWFALLIESAEGVRQQLEAARAATPYQHVTHLLRQTIEPNARVLLSNQFWFALPQHETRSIFLPYFLSSPVYNPQHTLSMSEVLRQLAPQYILADSIIEPQPIAPIGPNAAQQADAFARYRRQQCAEVVFTFSDPTYGPLTLYRCQTP